jgi:hypothetical protein
MKHLSRKERSRFRRRKVGVCGLAENPHRLGLYTRVTLSIQDKEVWKRMNVITVD